MAKKTISPTVIITGANGFVGSTLVDYFAGKGWKVVGLVRGAAGKKPRPNVRYEEYDLTKPVDDAIFAGATYLVHAAYIKYDGKHPHALEQNVQAASNLLLAAREHHLKKTVFMSSMSSHENAISIYGKQKLATEKLFHTKNDVILRCGLILGNGGLVKQMADFMASKHMVPLIGGGKQPLQIISVHDLARTIEQALTGKAHGIFTVAHPRVYTYKSFYRALADHLRIKVFFVPVPFSVLYGVMKMASVLPLPLSVSTDNLLGLKKLRSVDTSSDLKKIGVDLSDLAEALQMSKIKV